MSNHTENSDATEPEFELPPLPARPEDGHKGTFGTVLIIGGCDTAGTAMVGAPALVATAALRTGCGLAKVAAPSTILNEVLAIESCATGISLEQDEQTGALKPSECAQLIDELGHSATALAVGPGWGVGFEQQQIMMRLLADDHRPIVLDADALNNLALVPDFLQDTRAPLIVTPHPGEFIRLADALGIDADPKGDDAARADAAEKLAQHMGATVVLKGAGTIVTDGQQHWICSIREPALATAGSGDVLTGIIASLVAQFFKPHLGMGRVTPKMQGGLDLLQCAALGVEIHARCAAAWSEKHDDAHAGMLASDLCEHIPDVVREMRDAV